VASQISICHLNKIPKSCANIKNTICFAANGLLSSMNDIYPNCRFIMMNNKNGTINELSLKENL